MRRQGRRELDPSSEGCRVECTRRYMLLYCYLHSALISPFFLGTSKITQQSVSKTLMICADRPNYLTVPEIRSEVLVLLAGYCSDRVCVHMSS